MIKQLLMVVLVGMCVIQTANASVGHELAPSLHDDIKKQAITTLRKSRYKVQEMWLDIHKDQPVLKIKALRDKNQYEIIMTYPSLKVISERRY